MDTRTAPITDTTDDTEEDWGDAAAAHRGPDLHVDGMSLRATYRVIEADAMSRSRNGRHITAPPPCFSNSLAYPFRHIIWTVE